MATEPLHERFDWFDQARGLVVIMLLSSMIVGELEGDIVMREPFLGPTFLNHGYDYYDGTPALITLIDVGQPIFVFMMGFAATIAFSSRIERRGGLRKPVRYPQRRHPRACGPRHARASRHTLCVPCS